MEGLRMATVAKPALSGVGRKDGFFIHRIQKGYAVWIGLLLFLYSAGRSCRASRRLNRIEWYSCCLRSRSRNESDKAPLQRRWRCGSRTRRVA